MTGHEYIETVIVGAGQAGLSTGYHLQRGGRQCVILDASARIGDNWRQQWDSLRLYSPARYDGLPGLAFPGKPWSFPSKDDVASFLESYAANFRLPIRTGTRVERLVPREGGGYRITTTTGFIDCDNVVVATGTFGRTPYVPAFAGELDPMILQLHSSQYRRPNQLGDGPVLVVGASHSGTDIAYEVAQTHETTLAGRDCGQIPPRLDSLAMKAVFPVMVFAWRHVLSRRTPIGRKALPHIRFHGGPMLRVKRSDLAARGVHRILARIERVLDGRPALGDGTVLDVSTVIWCTGFRQVFDWIELPVFGPDGWPREFRGVVGQAPGLYFCGLAFQYAFASMVLAGVGRDAEHIARMIDRSSDRAARATERLAA